MKLLYRSKKLPLGVVECILIFRNSCNCFRKVQKDCLGELVDYAYNTKARELLGNDEKDC